LSGFLLSGRPLSRIISTDESGAGLPGSDRWSPDLCAIELCLDAGFNGELCLPLFDVLENAALDRGAIDAVYGPESLLDPTDPQQGSTA
jgi:hypothetical protein